jgi:D-lactate dehydrogenase (cytochrome)
MRDHIVNLTVVLADGTIIKTRQRPRKSSAGYNLNHLFCGSEGTLGLITEITVKLQPVPEETSIAVCSFPTVKDATSTAIDIIRAGIQVNAVEFMDDTQMRAIIDAGYTTRPWEIKPALFIKFAGTKNSVEEQIERTRVISSNHGGSSFQFAKSKEEQEELWAARKAVLWANLAVGPQGGSNYSTDVAVPMSRLADLVNKTKQDIIETGVWGACLGHVGDGNFHVGIVFEDKDYDKATELSRRIVYNGLAMEGTCTGEHGVGVGKRGYLIDEVGPDTVNLMRTIKLALDPLELMNPGKIFSCEELAARAK